MRETGDHARALDPSAAICGWYCEIRAAIRLRAQWPNPASSSFARAAASQSARWLGRCPDCQEWNTLVEERLEAVPARAGGRGAGRAAAPQPIAELATASESRCGSGIDELDRVLGGGVVPGSVILIGGDPGIGKSTLVLQALAHWRASGPALYVSGEESPQQIKMRADRLGVGASNLLVLAETHLEAVLRARAQIRAGDSGRRLDPDRVHRAARLGAGQHRSGARERGALGALRQAPGARVHPGRPRHQGRGVRRPARARAHGRHGRSTSRAIAVTRFASCARSRTASARPTRSACSR